MYDTFKPDAQYRTPHSQCLTECPTWSSTSQLLFTHLVQTYQDYPSFSFHTELWLTDKVTVGVII